ncbi:ABC-F family ATP-binding cassette domain-containing protein, partial [Geobacillus sp. MMMUD3]|nr:ABC-F family ATP-binding cassette domain-containing protein [Geobacillus sp. MMMUD3]
MIQASGLEVAVGARTLMSDVSFRVDKGDRVGLVGRNGAGKTTLTKVIMGGHPANAGSVSVSGTGGDLQATAKERILGARDLDVLVKRLRKAERQMASPDADVAAKAIDRYPRIEAEFVAAGGYAAESEAYAIAANLGLDEDLVNQEIGTLSGGQRRRVELARILFSAPDTMILDEPTNHLDAESVLWLRDYLKAYS